MPKPESKSLKAAALVGSDLFLQLAALRDLLRSLAPDTQTIDFDGESAELAAVLDEARSFSLFCGGKVVLVRNADDFIKKYRQQLEDYLEKESGGAPLILRLSSLPSNQRIYKLIEKTGRIVRCEAPKDPTAWIIERGKQAHKLAVAPDAARLLADFIGNDLGRLDMELAKLAVTCPNGSLAARDVTGAVAFQREREMYDLTNALAAGDSAAALRRWRQLVQLDSSAEYRAVTWLGIWLENVRRALEMLARGENAFAIGQTLRIWPRETAEKFVQTARGLGGGGLAAAMHLLAQIDFQTKTGVGDAADNIERFILAMAGRTDAPSERRAEVRAEVRAEASAR
jgi:DNA polymerase III subunit delta